MLASEELQTKVFSDAEKHGQPRGKLLRRRLRGATDVWRGGGAQRPRPCLGLPGSGFCAEVPSREGKRGPKASAPHPPLPTVQPPLGPGPHPLSFPPDLRTRRLWVPRAVVAAAGLGARARSPPAHAHGFSQERGGGYLRLCAGERRWRQERIFESRQFLSCDLICSGPLRRPSFPLTRKIPSRSREIADDWSRLKSGQENYHSQRPTVNNFIERLNGQNQNLGVPSGG
ncbi:uncharacterized protein LOC103099367 [Monodelphis domestica]|uniref:uncharacterized protein LOC103099367 n=1 Tax=Monodelphis domestica TaxID=13616 RepID=UPI0024E2634F|nr:uncharacterized protein LOC103099367 [Monodelphis domestica]